jgi:hypothetical protein
MGECPKGIQKGRKGKEGKKAKGSGRFTKGKRER